MSERSHVCYLVIVTVRHISRVLRITVVLKNSLNALERCIDLPLESVLVEVGVGGHCGVSDVIV